MLRFGSDLWVVLVLVLVGGRGVGWGGTGGGSLVPEHHCQARDVRRGHGGPTKRIIARVARGA